LSESTGLRRGSVNTEVMYNNLINKFKWGGLNKPGVYVDENNRRMLTNMRNSFQRLADALIFEGKKDSAIKVLDFCMEVIPPEKVPHGYFSLQIAKSYVSAGADEKSKEFIQEIADTYLSEVQYYLGYDNKRFIQVENEIRSTLFFVNELLSLTKSAGYDELYENIKSDFDVYYNQLMNQPM
jgi:hypothetical protein